MRNLFLMSIALSVTLANAQSPVKEFLDANHRICDSSGAVYYRLITYDTKDQPIGSVSEYYLTGLLSWEGRFSKFNRYDLLESRYDGICTWYYPSGKKKKTLSYTNGRLNGKALGWYDNGKIQYQFNYKDGFVDGLFLHWYDNGLLKTYALFNDGMVMGNQVINCDPFGECYTQTLYSFLAGKSYAELYSYLDMESILGDRTGYSCCSYYNRVITAEKVEPDDFIRNHDSLGIRSRLVPRKGLEITCDKKEGYLLQPMGFSDNIDFKISTQFTVEGNLPSGMNGFIFGYKDKNNFDYIFIDGNMSNYHIGAKHNGSIKVYAEGKLSFYKEHDYFYAKKRKDGKSGKCLFQVVRLADTLLYYSGYDLVFKRKLDAFEGDYMGYYVSNGHKLVVSSLNIKQEVEAPFVAFDSDAKKIEKPWRWSGSGFMATADGYIVTNHHVIEDAKEIEADLYRNGAWQHYQCEVVIADEKSDLAILKITDPEFIPFTSIPYRIRTDLASVGEDIFVLGYPYAMSALGNEIKFTEGTINARTGYRGELVAYQISAPIQPGNSGGPLFTSNGDIVGVVNSKLMKADNVAFAIKSNYIFNLFYMLPAEIKSGQSTLGGMEPADQVAIIKEFIPLIKVR